MDKPAALRLMTSYFKASKITLEFDGKIVSRLTGIKVDMT
jgi:hypothetical protein